VHNGRYFGPLGVVVNPVLHGEQGLQGGKVVVRGDQDLAFRAFIVT
jgi:hypothetical protein